MREKIYQFMQGRYGSDDLSKFLLGTELVMVLLNMFTRKYIFHLLFWVIFFYNLYRMFSKNHTARFNENRKFLDCKNRIKYQWENHRKLREQKKIYHIYSCPYCKQKIRIPKGKGTIIVTCPKCKREFGKRS